MTEFRTYTPEIAREICERLAAGETLRAICADAHLPHRSTVHEWIIENHEGFADRYARARDTGLDEMADEIIEISDDGRNDWMEREDPDNPGYNLNGEHLQRSRLRTDSRKWYLAKLAPKRYGERTTIAGDPDAPLAPGTVDLTTIVSGIAGILDAARQRRLADGSDLA